MFVGLKKGSRLLIISLLVYLRFSAQGVKISFLVWLLHILVGAWKSYLGVGCALSFSDHTAWKNLEVIVQIGNFSKL